MSLGWTRAKSYAGHRMFLPKSLSPGRSKFLSLSLSLSLSLYRYLPLSLSLLSSLSLSGGKVGDTKGSFFWPEKPQRQNRLSSYSFLNLSCKVNPSFSQRCWHSARVPKRRKMSSGVEQ